MIQKKYHSHVEGKKDKAVLNRVKKMCAQLFPVNLYIISLRKYEQTNSNKKIIFWFAKVKQLCSMKRSFVSILKMLGNELNWFL